MAVATLDLLKADVPVLSELEADLGGGDRLCMLPVVRSTQTYQAFRISPTDTNRIVLLFDPTVTNYSMTVCVEIFDPGGGTPYHRHRQADEMFFVLRGEGAALCDGKEVALTTGDCILVRPTGMHEIHNTSANRLYLLSVMVPNEDFAELVRSGVPAELDAEDLAVLRHQPLPIATLP
ncbi:MAG: cupin domain-containing protein [Synechococcales cyanobacterium CRU_2_2]|nr:cupin domain-containing protein [Synechococcales cyanobacterium CRU_2_2]